MLPGSTTSTSPTYPYFVQNGSTFLRYNSPTWVCLAGPSQLQVQRLVATSTPHLLHSAGNARPCTEQDFKTAAEAAYKNLLAAYQQPDTAATTYQRRRELPDGWFYRRDGPQVELRLNLSEYDGQLSVNWLLEGLNIIPGLVIIGSSRASDPRRVPSTAQEYNAALAQAIPVLVAAARGQAPTPSS